MSQTACFFAQGVIACSISAGMGACTASNNTLHRKFKQSVARDMVSVIFKAKVQLHGTIQYTRVYMGIYECTLV